MEICWCRSTASTHRHRSARIPTICTIQNPISTPGFLGLYRSRSFSRTSDQDLPQPLGHRGQHPRRKAAPRFRRGPGQESIKCLQRTAVCGRCLLHPLARRRSSFRCQRGSRESPASQVARQKLQTSSLHVRPDQLSSIRTMGPSHQHHEFLPLREPVLSKREAPETPTLPGIFCLLCAIRGLTRRF